MTKNPITVPLNYTIEENVEILLKHKISGVPVIDHFERFYFWLCFMVLGYSFRVLHEYFDFLIKTTWSSVKHTINPFPYNWYTGVEMKTKNKKKAIELFRRDKRGQQVSSK